MKILIIEDDEDFFEAVKETILLEESFENFEIEHSFSGEEGLRKLEFTDYNIIITDYDLGPNLMCGLDIVKETVKRFPNIPIIVLTAQGDMELSVECYRSGAIDFVNKNMEHELFLIKAIHMALHIIKQKQTENMKSELQHILIHDLKTPLSCIVSSIDIIQNKHKVYDIKDSRLNSVVGSCKLSCKQMTSYVNNILFLENLITILDKEEFNLKSSLNSLISLFSIIFEMNNINFQLSYSGHEEIYSNEIHIEHILFNLLSNAIDHSSINDSITITVINNNNTVLFEITNTGSVIPEGYELKIFDRNFSSHSSNLNQGFGLSFCKKAITILGGEIKAYSNIEKNSTTFYFNLPSKISNS